VRTNKNLLRTAQAHRVTPPPVPSPSAVPKTSAKSTLHFVDSAHAAASSPNGFVLHPDNLYDRYFLPVLEKAGLRHIRLHDLRHTFGSQLIQSGASLAYVKEQMGHSSIQVTVDIYGHLIPGANVACVDRLDTAWTKTTPQPNATPAQPRDKTDAEIPVEVIDLIGGGGWTRTNDLGIMRPSL
jgi:hypothetical protein